VDASIRLEVRYAPTFRSKSDALIDLASANALLCIVREAPTCERLADILRAAEVSCTTVHEESSPEERATAVEDFRQGRARVLIAAARAGRDLPAGSVPLVVHYHCPSSLGRYVSDLAAVASGGRGVVLYTPADRIASELAIESAHQGDDLTVVDSRTNARRDLRQVIGYLTSRECRRVALATRLDEPVSGPCGNCDVCEAPRPDESCFSPEARKLARRVLEHVACIDGRFGRHRVAQVLSGSNAGAIVQMNLHELPFHGALARYSLAGISSLFSDLIAGGAMEEMELAEDRPVLRLTEHGRAIARGEAEVDVPVKIPPERGGKGPSAASRIRADIIERCSTGESPAQCASALGIPEDKAWKHLLDALAEGGLQNPDAIVDRDRRRTVADAAEHMRRPSLKLLKKVLPADFGDHEIRYILARIQGEGD
jgi:ATP-dependent DNA helicase RecQ